MPRVLCLAGLFVSHHMDLQEPGLQQLVAGCCHIWKAPGGLQPPCAPQFASHVNPAIAVVLCVSWQDPAFPDSLKKGLLPGEAGQGVLRQCQRKSVPCKT